MKTGKLPVRARPPARCALHQSDRHHQNAPRGLLSGIFRVASNPPLTPPQAPASGPLLPRTVALWRGAPCPDGGIGRRTSFRCWRSQGRGGSSPLLGTSYSQDTENSGKSSERRSPERVCDEKLLRFDAASFPRKSQNTVSYEPRGCHGKLLRDLPRGVLRRGQRLYYRHTVPVDAQRLLNRLEIWRSLRTDSLAVALRRLPSVVARIEMEIEHARSIAGLPVDATLTHSMEPGRGPHYCGQVLAKFLNLPTQPC